MFSLGGIAARGAKTTIRTRFTQLSRSSRPFSLLLSPSIRHPPSSSLPNKSTFISSPKEFSTKSEADGILEELQDQYATAKDEFEIAAEETEKKTVYAEGDRKAAREELDTLKGMFEDAVKSGEGVGEEVQKRVGGRIRELDEAVKAMEERALEE